MPKTGSIKAIAPLNFCIKVFNSFSSEKYEPFGERVLPKKSNSRNQNSPTLAYIFYSYSTYTSFFFFGKT